MEDLSKRFIGFVGRLEVPEASQNYNITGKSAAHVIAIFKSMVNNRDAQYGYRESEVFTFEIGNPPTIIFKLQARPTEDQPGNGFIQRNNNTPTYKSITKDLMKQYENDTETFAKDMKSVFKDNSELFKCSAVVSDVYILLLFEIGRRLVIDGKESTNKKKALDKLPISAALTSIFKLFESPKTKYSFRDFFHDEGKFHCFSDGPQKREDAIESLTKLSEVEFEEIKALFYEEEDKESSEDAASEGKESSLDATNESGESSEGATSESKESSKNAASKGKKSSKDATGGGEEYSKDAASQGKESSDDAAS